MTSVSCIDALVSEKCDTSLGQISNSANPVKIENQYNMNECTEITSSEMIQHFVDQGEYTFMREVKFNIHIFADDHGRGLALILKKIFSNDSEIFSFVKPRARLTGVMSGCLPEQFTDTDNVIIIGGTNDITFNGGKEVFGNLEFMLISLKKTNVWLCTLPYRFDLIDSCVEHDYIVLVNNYIRELAGKMQHVKLIDLHKLQRHHFTVNGFCMNTRGKIRFARAILDSISAETFSQYPSNVKPNGLKMPHNRIQLSEKKNNRRVVNPVSTGTSTSKGWNLFPLCISRLFWWMLDSICCSSSQLTDSAVVVHGGRSKTAQTISHVNRLSRKLQRRLTRRTIAEARALKQQGADTLHCLIYLADLLARDPKAFIEKARQMWAHLSEDEPENQVPPANLEQLIAMLTREVARRIVHAVNYTGSTVSRIPHRVGNTIHAAAYNINSMTDYVLRIVHLEKVKSMAVVQARLQFAKAQEFVSQIKVLGINLLESILSRMNSAVHRIHPSPGLKQIAGQQKALPPSSPATTSSTPSKKSPPTQSQNSSNDQNGETSPQSNSSSPKDQDQNNSTPSKKKEKSHDKEKAQSKEHSAKDTVQ